MRAIYALTIAVSVACVDERTYEVDGGSFSSVRAGHPVYCLHFETDPTPFSLPAAKWNAILGRPALRLESCPAESLDVDILPAFEHGKTDGTYEGGEVSALYIDRAMRSRVDVELTLRDLGHVLCQCNTSNPDPESAMNVNPRRGARITQTDIDLVNAVQW